ncbi:F420-0:Gamma-glutamyl ligase [Synechococcus sp. CC9616]|uniref:F420-0:Gamma-glutamyl ligase n=1 Tax=Synechococcus sp. CC9616 TaxID=110663 RepID=UPI0012EC24DC|nr:F420-0:Gamma-glutamyl ligase [Synechococcus sp. CC9616]
MILLLLLGLAVAWIELRHRLRPASPLTMRAIDWAVAPLGSEVRVTGVLEISNPHHRMEVFVPELRVDPVLLGKAAPSQLQVSTTIDADHPDEDSRADGYWAAYIVKGRKSTRAKVTITLRDPSGSNPLDRFDSLWADVHWINYGPFGRLARRQGLLVSLNRPQPLTAANAEFRVGDGCRVLPLRTHLLGTLDDPIEMLRTYASDLLQPGDVLTIGETPVAVIQSRYRHPSEVQPGLVARLACRVFHPTSSLATACGLQTLIDLVGPTRVLVAWIGGLLLKLVGVPGGFYRLAGDQARLIDDITGTTPPYDQTIVLGPDEPEALCQRAATELGVAVAIVDVNDLGRVKVLASSRGCDEELLQRALRPNPAGNANERTPLVLVRPGIA